ncbi:hypothetical protein [Citrobacter werkmanii]|uniref:hypothetical protein n=1 Tax=Citrobacter werkmanii TaxID=67827 RepID=UPI003B0259DC
MHRIDTPTAQKDKFGAGKNGFTRGNPQTGTPATDMDDDYFDMLQEELAGVVEATGVNLEKSKHNQLLTALKALLLSRAHPFADIKADGPTAVAEALSNLGLEHFGYEPSTGETAIFNGNKNLRYFINNNNESGVASIEFGLIWGFDGAGKLVKGIIPVARLDGLSGGTGSSTTAVMHQKAVTDAINNAKTTVVQLVGTSTTSVMSQNAVTSLVNDAASVGVNQLWNDVTSSRTVGINYTNTTGRPIMIAMNVKNVTAGLFASSIFVQGIELSAGSTVSGEHRFISAIVPPGQVYRYQPLASSNFVLLELR